MGNVLKSGRRNVANESLVGAHGAGLVVVLAVPAFAGADATFGPGHVVDQLYAGSLGTLLALVAGAIGLGSAMADPVGRHVHRVRCGGSSLLYPNIIPTITTGLV